MKEGRATRRSRLTTGLLLLVGAAVLALGVAVHTGGLHLQTVLSNSMQPTASAGDLAVTIAIPTSSLAVGDVITFSPPGSAEVLMHRISSVENGVITTRGDANSVDDPWRVALTDATAYRLVAVAPALGRLTQLERPVLLVAGLLMGLSLLLELRKGVKARAMPSQPQPQA